VDGDSEEYRMNPNIYGIEIRKDKPYVLDFSNKPEVMFASPSMNQRIKAGVILEIRAYLHDPVTDIIVLELRYSSFCHNKRLDPKIIITRQNGEVISKGSMSSSRYAFLVPKDLKLNGKEETFNISYIFGTKELYGEVSATRSIVIYRD
jgi:hypothetical protein